MKIYFSFQTCTMMEAIDEINIVLRSMEIPIQISEVNLASLIPVKKEEPDDFDDAVFTFEAEVESKTDYCKICDELCGTGVGVCDRMEG